MIRAYLFALDPTEQQEQQFRSHCGAQRYAYNFGVELAGKIRAQRAAEYSYGLRGAELTPCSAYDLRRAWNAAKHERAPWWAENSKEAYSSGLANAAAAFKNFGDSFRGTRRGPKIRHPRFKGRRARLTCRFTTGAFGLGADRRHVKLPRIGAVRTHESTRKLARRVEAGTARILAATLSHQRGRWHVSLSVELPDPQPARADRRPGGRRRPGHQVPGRAVHRGGRAQPAAPRRRPHRAPSRTTEVRPPPRAGPPHPRRPVQQVA